MLRVAGIEVVDRRGRPRVLLGQAEGASAPFGLWVVDDGGQRRLWLGVDAGEASLALGRAGTVVAGMGSHGVDLGAYAFVARPDGTPAAGWFVPDGGAAVRRL